MKSLHRIGLTRDTLREDECMKLGFPLESAYDFNAIEAGPMPKFHGNADAIIVGKNLSLADFELKHLHFVQSLSVLIFSDLLNDLTPFQIKISL